jgi:hypothetical protein
MHDAEDKQELKVDAKVEEHAAGVRVTGYVNLGKVGGGAKVGNFRVISNIVGEGEQVVA